MRENIPLNSINSPSPINNNISEPLLINNYNSLNYNRNFDSNRYKRGLVPTNVALFTFKGKPLKKIEDKIICGSKRRKFPNKISKLSGYLMSFSLFLGFTILLTICICSSKSIPSMTDSLKKNIILYFFLYGFQQ